MLFPPKNATDPRRAKALHPPVAGGRLSPARRDNGVSLQQRLTRIFLSQGETRIAPRQHRSQLTFQIGRGDVLQQVSGASGERAVESSVSRPEARWSSLGAFL